MCKRTKNVPSSSSSSSSITIIIGNRTTADSETVNLQKKYLYRREQLKIKLKWGKKETEKNIHNSETHSLLSNSKLLPKSQWTLKCIHDDDLEFTTSKIIINAELSSMSITPDHPSNQPVSEPASSNTTTTIAIDHQHHRHRHSGPQCMPSSPQTA